MQQPLERFDLDVSQLVPDEYAEYRSAVAAGLVYFVQNLSPKRLAEIMQAQASLPADSDVLTRLVCLIHASPALHKLGQVLARRRELDVHLRQRLQQLESMEPSTPLCELQPTIERELGKLIRNKQVRIAETALAEASVAVVIPFTWPGNHVHPPLEQRGVLKVLKPQAAEKLSEDLQVLAKLADYLDDMEALPGTGFRDAFEETRAILAHEIQMEREQANLRQAGTIYAGDSRVVIPRLMGFSTPHVIAMSRLFGAKVTQMARTDRLRRRNLARTIVRALVARPILSNEPSVMFHGDPHAGNLMALSHDRLGILDWSLTGQLREEDRVAMSQILMGAICGDRRRIVRAIDELANSSPPAEVVTRPIDRALESWQVSSWPGIDWMMRLLDNCARAGVRFRGDLLLFRKAFFMLEGVVADLCPGCKLECILLENMVEESAGEWPRRWLRPMNSRRFATHLSNADLMEIAASAPLQFMKLWTEPFRRWLQSLQTAH